MSNFRRDPKSGLLLPSRLRSGPLPSRKRQGGFISIGPSWWGSAAPINYQTVVLADSPLLYYRMGVTVPASPVTGSTVPDLSGNGFNGTLGSLTTGHSPFGSSIVPVTTSPCMIFNSFLQGVFFPSVTALTALTYPLSLELWMSPTFSGQTAEMFCTGNSGAVAIYQNSGSVWLGRNEVSNDGHSNTALTGGNIYYVVATISAAGVINFYFNAAKDTQTSSTSTAYGGTAGQSGAIATNPYGGIGNYAGEMQELAIYNYALTQTQINNHYAAGIA